MISDGIRENAQAAAELGRGCRAYDFLCTLDILAQTKQSRWLRLKLCNLPVCGLQSSSSYDNGFKRLPYPELFFKNASPLLPVPCHVGLWQSLARPGGPGPVT
jgi:hypothetical protein